MAAERTVYIVDDDEAVRDALGMLFRSAGLQVQSYASAADFLAGGAAAAPACLVLDIRMPQMSGLALQDELARRGVRMPVIFITGHGDIPMAVQAVKKGAFDFIEKPFDHDRLLGQVLSALEPRPATATPSARLGELSKREREVLDQVLAGKPSRQIGEELFISVKTVEFHRARIMHKLGAHSAAELFRICLAGQDAR